MAASTFILTAIRGLKVVFKKGLKAVYKNKIGRLGHHMKVFSPKGEPLLFKMNPLLSSTLRLRLRLKMSQVMK
jgi:hypothetical protein